MHSSLLGLESAPTLYRLPVALKLCTAGRLRAPVSAISISQLVVRRGGRTVLDGVSLDIESARITGLLGPSGCGKSTLMRAIVGVQRVAGGTVRVLGQEAGTPALRRRVGYVTQAPSVYADLTVRQNLDYFARVLSAPRDAVDRVIDTVELREYAAARVGRLSGGQRARVSLAVALLGTPELLVLDEPTVGLDPVLRRELWGTFRQLTEQGVTLLVSSHVMDEADRCDDLVLMRDGAVLASEPREQLLRRTGQPDVEQAFLQLVGAA
jgi:ABC-2 type transport system ATP-binding protein